MAHWDLWFDYFFLFSMPVTILYCFVLWLILHSKQKRIGTMYFKLYVITGIFDVQLCIAIQYVLIISNIGAGPSQEPISRVALFMTGSHYSTHFFGNLAMACYQFTMVFNSHWAKQFWQNRILCIFYIFIFVYNCAVFVPLLWVRLVYKEVSPDFYVRTGREEQDTMMRGYIVDSLVSSICQVFSMLFIVLTAIKIGIDKKKTMIFSSSQSYSASTEQRHLVFTALNTILIGLVVGYDATALLGDLNSTNPLISYFVANMIKVIFIIMAINGPMMLATSKQVRKEMWRIVSRTKENNNISIHVTSRSR